MMRIFFVWPVAIVLSAFLAAAVANADPIGEQQVRALMSEAETLLARQGVSVAGYATSASPVIAVVSASHPYLQGRDGGFANARIYVNENAIEACVDLIVLHELVHDATMKHRLFATVPNERVKDAAEALADAVTADAAENQYRPGCLPHRRFVYAAAELAQLAMAPAAP